MSLGYRKAKSSYGKPMAPAEPVDLKVFRNQVVELRLPYHTSRAGEIREYSKAKIVIERKMIFIFNTLIEEWRNETPRSTAQKPELTAAPVIAVEKAVAELARCPAVAQVTILNENDQPITLEQVRAAATCPPHTAPLVTISPTTTPIP